MRLRGEHSDQIQKSLVIEIVGYLFAVEKYNIDVIVINVLGNLDNFHNTV